MRFRFVSPRGTGTPETRVYVNDVDITDGVLSLNLSADTKRGVIVNLELAPNNVDVDVVVESDATIEKFAQRIDAKNINQDRVRKLGGQTSG